MPQELTAEQAAARLKAADTLGMPLGPRPAAGVHAHARRAQGLDGSACLRAATQATVTARDDDRRDAA